MPIDTNPATIFKEDVTDRIWTVSKNALEIPVDILPGIGYWVYSRGKNSIPIRVRKPLAKDILLNGEGWNSVAVFKRNSIPSGMADFLTWAWSHDRFEILVEDETLNPLNGYFVYNPEDFTACLETKNIPPVAHAGSDQSVFVSSLVSLDGSQSVDANNDSLNFQWKFLSKPGGSSATLSNPEIPNPTFFIDLPGTYGVQLIVNDGIEDSNPDLARISIDYSKQITIDLEKIQPYAGVLTRIYGSTGDGRAGVPVAGGFDCDGDGFLDNAFAAIKASPLGRSGAGEVALVFGNGSIGGQIDTAGFQNNVLKIAGAQPFEVTGAEIWMGDVTGDGLGDLLICRQNYTPESGREGAGALSIIVGDPALRTFASNLEYLDLSLMPDNITTVTILGVNAYDRLGIWVRTGDITGDAIADIVVGSDEVDSANEQNGGAVYVIRGGDHLGNSRIIDLKNFGMTSLAGQVARIKPPSGSQRFHLGSTCQIADLDGNGRGEVLMSAALNRAGAGIRLPNAPPGTGQSSGGSDRGTLFIAWDDNFPSSLWGAGYEFDISSPTLGTRTIIEGGSSNRAFGEEILGGLDYDGDTLPDLFIGDLVANTENGVQSGAGHVFFNASNLRDRVFSMILPPADVKFSFIKGPSTGAIGADTAAHGDFNGDGIGDLAIGNPHDNPNGRTNAGSIHLLLGQVNGWPDVIDLAKDNLPTPESMRITSIYGAFGTTGGDNGDTLCYSATAANIDGDKYTDIIVNEMAGNGIAPGATDVGNLLLISGAALFNLESAVESDE